VTATNRGSAERRPRSPRGQGGRLREEILEAATALLAESGNAPGLSLRGVAKRVGVAATSVYLHYADVESLAADVAAHAFAELGAALAAAAPGGADPAETLLARCRAYGHFALDHPGLYRVMFEAPRPDLAAGEPYSLEESPGRAVLVRLARDLERCQEAGLAPADVQQVLLAGSFGSYLSPASAIKLGLVPKLGVMRVVSAGNVAGEGAKMALLSVRERAAALALLEEVRYVELSDRPDFNDRFVEQLQFPH